MGFLSLCLGLKWQGGSVWFGAMQNRYEKGLSEWKEEVYIDQLEGFHLGSKGHVVCKLKKSIYMD